MGDVITKFIAPMSVHFRLRHPDEESEKIWTQDFVQRMSHWDDAVLSDSAEEFIRTRKNQNFPSIAECNAIASRVDARKKPPPQKSGSDHDKDWTREAIAKADVLIQSDLGKIAAQQGWIGALHTFCRKHGHLPYGDDVERVKQTQRDFILSKRSCEKGGWPLAKALLALANSMDDKAEKLAKIALGEGGNP